MELFYHAQTEQGLSAEEIRAALIRSLEGKQPRKALLLRIRQEANAGLMEKELETYRRAERMERLARERAEQVYHQANAALADATVKVDAAALQISQMSDAVLTQLNGLQSAVNNSKQALTDAAATMYAIRPTQE